MASSIERSNKRVSSQILLDAELKLRPTAEAMIQDLARSGLRPDDAARMQLEPLNADQVLERTKPKNDDKSGIYSSGGYAIPYFDASGKRISFTRLSFLNLSLSIGRLTRPHRESIFH